MNPSSNTGNGDESTNGAANSAAAGEQGNSRTTKAHPTGTTAAHRGVTLMGFSFVVFEVFFLTLYSDSYWFPVDLTWLGAPAVLVAMVIAHLLLVSIESRKGLQIASCIFKGLPPVVYRKWATINERSYAPGVEFGLRRVTFEAIDELELTFWGNLRLKSYSLCGRFPKPPATAPAASASKDHPPDVILKLPLGVASPAHQKELVAVMQKHKSAMLLNKRLVKQINAPELTGKAQAWIQQLGVVFLFLVLLDVGHSTFTYLEILKSYYQAQQTALTSTNGSRGDAQKLFDRAETLRQHPLTISWVSNKLLNEGIMASGILQARADALWRMERKDEAVQSAREALALSPKSWRINLKLARYLTFMGDGRKAHAEIETAISDHKGSFLPRLYMLALKKEHGIPGPARAAPTDTASSGTSLTGLYKKYRDELDDEVFGKEPVWPPGGNRFLHDVFYRDDITYIFDRLIGDKPKQ